jgi:hypothetical protein
MKTDPPLGPSERDRLAQTLASRGDMRRSSMGTLVAVEILIAPLVVSSYHSVMKNLLWKENEST